MFNSSENNNDKKLKQHTYLIKTNTIIFVYINVIINFIQDMTTAQHGGKEEEKEQLTKKIEHFYFPVLFFWPFFYFCFIFGSFDGNRKRNESPLH